MVEGEGDMVGWVVFSGGGGSKLAKRLGGVDNVKA